MTGHEDDNQITHVVPDTIPTRALIDELIVRFKAEGRAFVLGFQTKDADGKIDETTTMVTEGLNRDRFWLAHCVLDFVKKRAAIGFPDREDE